MTAFRVNHPMVGIFFIQVYLFLSAERLVHDPRPLWDIPLCPRFGFEPLANHGSSFIALLLSDCAVRSIRGMAGRRGHDSNHRYGRPRSGVYVNRLGLHAEFHFDKVRRAWADRVPLEWEGRFTFALLGFQRSVFRPVDFCNASRRLEAHRTGLK